MHLQSRRVALFASQSCAGSLVALSGMRGKRDNAAMSSGGGHGEGSRQQEKKARQNGGDAGQTDGFRVQKEGKAEILVRGNDVFYNKAQVRM